MNIPRDDAWLINWDLRNVIYNKNSFSLARILRFNDPLIYVLDLKIAVLGSWAVNLILFLSQLVEMAIKISKFIRQIVCIRDDIKFFFAIFFLQSDNVWAKAILSSQFIAIWKMVNFLVFIETFIDILLITLARP